MTDNAISSASHGAFDHLVHSVTVQPCKAFTGRVSERKRAKNGLQRLLDAIERTPAQAVKRAEKRST